MRTFTMLFLTFFALNLFASSDWTDYWIAGTQAFEEKDLFEAEKKLNLAIELIENDNVDYPYVYLTRAELYLKDDRFQLALEDVERALLSQSLTRTERYEATLIKISAKAHFSAIEAEDPDLKYLIESSDLRVEHTKEKIIIRNLPKCESFNEQLPCYFIHSGICEKKEDIKITKSGVYIVKKRCGCGCKNPEINEVRYCDCCGIQLDHYTGRVQQRTIDGCKGWCDLHSVNGCGWCAKCFTGSCLVACNAAIVIINRGCHWCCSEGAFYDKCVAPFGDIISKMPSHCDPEWD